MQSQPTNQPLRFVLNGLLSPNNPNGTGYRADNGDRIARERVEEDTTMEERVEEIVEENAIDEAERQKDDIMESGDEYYSADDEAARMAVNTRSWGSSGNLDAANDLSPTADTPRVTVSG